MKRIFALSLVVCFLTPLGCQTTEMKKEPASSITVQDGAKVPDQFKKKSAKELRREERRRQKASTFFYNR